MPINDEIKYPEVRVIGANNEQLGVMKLDEGFVKAVADFCNENDILLIIDEVQTGNGRTGELYGYMNYGITPDVANCLIHFAKSIGIGFRC